MRQLSILFLLAAFCAHSHVVRAQHIGEEEARQCAEAFFDGHGRHFGRSGDAVRLLAKNKVAYVFASAGDFVAVAADERLPEVVGYGVAGDGEMPEALQGLMRQWERARLSAALAAHSRRIEPVQPLLTFVRHQKSPYNNCCPFFHYDNGTQSKERAVVGCVATALEEVISYYRQPVVLKDTLHGWRTPHYVIEDVLPGTMVDTRLIRDDYDAEVCSPEEIDAVARLSYYCGVAAKMNYGLGSSGASIHNLPESLARAFGFVTAVYLDSYRYKPNDWRQILENEIRNGRPVLYSGFMQTLPGHAFVLDGLDADGRFHVNWGYGGHYDGYFYLDILHAFEPSYDRTPFGDTYGFSCNTQALLVHPSEEPLPLPDTLRRTGREMVVDSLRFLQEPEVGKYAMLRLFLRNASSDSLTTPLVLFTNAPGDTAIFEQADCIGLTGISAAPGEQRTLEVPVIFSAEGDRLLRLSPDDSTLVFEQALSVAKEKKAQPVFGAVSVSFPKDSVARVEVGLSNRQGVGRMGHIITYCLFEGDVPEVQEGDVRHPKLCCLPAGEETVDTVFFHGLKPGAKYTLLVRQPWTVQAQCAFMVPETTGISSPEAGESRGKSYSLDGREVFSREKQIYIQNKRKYYGHPKH